MNSSNWNIIKQALAARTIKDAANVQKQIASAVGKFHQRPIGDRWNNQGILTGSGASYDHKVLEVTTNMQDAILELLALQKYGDRNSVPFTNPHEAAASLLAGMTKKEQAELASITIDKPTDVWDKKRVTLVMRDRGCGITADDIPQSIFHVGSKHKDGVDWLQGTFGLGGATTFRNAKSIVLVTRKHPGLLKPGEADRITVAVVQWEKQRTTVNAFYLVVRPWNDDDLSAWKDAVPFSVPATDYPEFEPGTHVALISYDTEGLGRRSGDEKSFDTIFNTRLYRPVLPSKYRNNITRPDRDETLDGLERRLNDNPGGQGTEGTDTLPFNHKGTTYQLPIRFRMFAKRGEKGQRRNFVAHRHTLLITSNGQVHSHWTPDEFKRSTKLNKLYDRILVVVESDALPIEIRTELFTADRTQFIRSAIAMRLEKEIAAFLNDWPELDEANKALIREAITGDNNDRPTIAIAEKIARAMKVRGFSTSGKGSRAGGNSKPPSPTPPENLYNDPTHFEGPEKIEAKLGEVKGIHFKLNANDYFLGPGGRSELQITCDHSDIDAGEITIGELRSGRIRVSIAVPETADLGIYKINAVIPEWPKTSGGLGPRFDWTTRIEFVEEIKRTSHSNGAGNKRGKKGHDEGGLVAVVWKSEMDEDMDKWTAQTVGEIEMVNANDLSKIRKEYEELSGIDMEIPTVVLNRTYSPLKKYIQARAIELTDEGKEQVRERYAVGTGVALLVIDQEVRKVSKSKTTPDEEAFEAGRRAAARAVLSVMPDYDRLAKEIED